MPVAIPVSRNPISEIEARIVRIDPLPAVNTLEFYIPGSSMRGAWRSHLERNLRGMAEENQAVVCDPLNDESDQPSSSCSRFWVNKRKRAEDERENEQVREEEIPYRQSCAVCKLFGHTVQAGRMAISDGERLNGPGRIVVRDHVAIDRRTGAVVSPFRFFGLQDAEFRVVLTIRNFELHQMWLLGWLLKDLEAENVPLGGYKNKGYGRVKATATRITLVYFGLSAPDNRLLGVAEHPRHGGWFAARYGLLRGVAPSISGAQWTNPTPWRQQGVLAGTTALSFLDVCRGIPFDANRFRLLSEIREGAAG